MGLFNKVFGKDDQKHADNDTNCSTGIFDAFIKMYRPATNLTKPTQQILDWYADKLPKELLNFWTAYGFGNYGDGLIKVVEPSEYMDSFYEWLGKEDHSRLPILVTGFGDIFYYRKHSDTAEDVSLLDIHYRNIEVCDDSLKSFFENYIVDPELAKELLKKPLFDQAVTKVGTLTYREIYFFEPALVLGGRQDIEYINKGTGAIHQLILHQIGQ